MHILPPSPFPLPPSLTWLPAGLLATLLMLAASLSAFGAEPSTSELKWQRPTTASTSTSTSSRVTNRLRDKGVRTPSPQSQVSSPSPNRLRDRALRTVAHEEDAGPVLRIADRNSGGFDSVVSPPLEAEPRSEQVAQQFGPQTPTGETPNGLEREIERPFELPPMDEPEPMPEPMIEPEPMPMPMDPTLEQPVEQPVTPPATQRDPFERNGFEPRLPDPAPDEPSSLTQEQQEAEENCQDELDKLRADALATISLEINVAGTAGEDFPFQCTVDDGSPFEPRCWAEVTYMWKASALCHKPLYFECEQMERYGHSWGPVADPFVAGAHFFTHLPVLPYCMGITPPNECIYALGHYRPGSCAPYMINPIPFTWRAAANQAAFTVGMVYFLP